LAIGNPGRINQVLSIVRNVCKVLESSPAVAWGCERAAVRPFVSGWKVADLCCAGSREGTKHEALNEWRRHDKLREASSLKRVDGKEDVVNGKSLATYMVYAAVISKP
jgi:hypothetical protein